MEVNPGNSILCAFIVSYAAPHTIEIRKNMLAEVQRIMQEKEVAFNK